MTGLKSKQRCSSHCNPFPRCVIIFKTGWKHQFSLCFFHSSPTFLSSLSSSRMPAELRIVCCKDYRFYLKPEVLKSLVLFVCVWVWEGVSKGDSGLSSGSVWVWALPTETTGLTVFICVGENEMAADTSGFTRDSLGVLVYPCVHTSQCEPAFVKGAPACTHHTLSSVFAAPYDPQHPLKLKVAN